MLNTYHAQATREAAARQWINLGDIDEITDMHTPTKTDVYAARTKLIRQYMADYTGTFTPPKAAKGGWYAVVSKVTGKVWLAQTTNFQTMLNRFKGKASALPKEMEKYREEGFGVYLSTKDIDIEALRFELQENDALLERADRTNNGEGNLYVISHSSGFYYLTKARTYYKDADYILTRFLTRVVDMRNSHHHQTNQILQQFVSDHARDILNQTGFAVREVGTFKDSDEAVEMMHQFHIEQSHMTCLNDVFDRR